ncbi:MAG: GNAT family N-acetyltransferase [Promethearchaeota archaeon]
MSKDNYFTRSTTLEETEELVRVLAAAFGSEPPYSGLRNFLATKVRDPRDRRVLVRRPGSAGSAREGNIVGGILHYRFRGHFGPNSLDCSGLGWVGVHPEFQGRGLGLELLDDAIAYLEGLGCDLCFLYTGKQGFYARRGWVDAFHHPNFVTSTRDVPPRELPDPECEFRRMERADLPQIARLYEQFYRDVPFTLVRDDEYWERALGSDVYCLVRGGRVLAYAWLAWGDKESHDRVVVQEYAVSSELPGDLAGLPRGTVERELLARVGEIAESREPDPCTELAAPLPPSLPIVGEILAAGGRDGTSLVSGQMVRIIDLPGFLRKVVAYQNEVLVPRVPAGKLEEFGDAEVVLSVEDHRIRVSKRGASLVVSLDPRPHEGLGGMGASTLSNATFDRSEFTMLVLGSFSASELVEYELWDCDETLLPVLDLVFPDIHGHVFPPDKF